MINKFLCKKFPEFSDLSVSLSGNVSLAGWISAILACSPVLCHSNDIARDGCSPVVKW